MMKKLFLFLLWIPLVGTGQSYTSYFTGNPLDTVTSPGGGSCLMGGATEDDNAMRWFLQRASGGDVLVLRASGSNGYNDYLYSSLGVAVHSVETIVFNNASAADDPYVLQKIGQAEAIWFAGGDQWDYVSYWRGTPVDSLINQGILQRNIVVGGTSAGMAILGQYYFSARNGTVTSETALANPYNVLVTVDSASFIKTPFLQRVITDTHFDDPDRRGRLITFLARILTDYGVFASAIACDEYTAVCVDTSGIARVFGDYPNSNDNAWFVQSNCELENRMPEACTPGVPLTWNLGGKAVKTYVVKGTPDGAKTFDLNDWRSGSGGNWKHWFADGGSFIEQTGTALDCGSSSAQTIESAGRLQLFPNPCGDHLQISLTGAELTDSQCRMVDVCGREYPVCLHMLSANDAEIMMTGFGKGYYLVVITLKDGGVVFYPLIKL